MKYLHLLWANLRRKKTRTILTVLSIFVAFVLFSLLVAVEHAMDMGVSVAGEDRLVVRHKVSLIQLLPESYESQIEQVEGVADATYATWFGGIYQDPRNYFAQFPVDPDEYLAMYPEFLLSEEERAAWRETRTGAVVGRGLAEKYGWKLGDKVPIQATIWVQEDGSRTWTFDVVGIYDGAEQGTDDTQFLFRYDYFDEARGMAKGEIGWYMIRVEDPERAAAVAAAVDARFANSAAETDTSTEKAFVQGFAKQVGNIGKMMAAVLGAVFFTILLVAGNTMAQAVRERTEELGVLKAMGFTSRQVLGLVVGESCLISVLGGGLGLALGWALVTLGGDPTGGALPIFFMPAPQVALGAALVVLLGLLAGALPALQAMRLRVADALRRG
ncbi:MAG: ABC transporter permease [Acidobacteriota bacterium]|nr:ABC transporter permease [Acidobacteriota bacterium]MDH3525208.1 ABC transporter permease [Acidobacteriota bacterium]